MIFDYGRKRVPNESSLDIYNTKENEPHSSVMESSDYDFAMQKYAKSDDPLIRNVVMKSQRVSHPMQMDLRNIYSNHKLAACEEVISYAYRKGDCSFCRSKIVHAMGKNGCLSDEILIECQYDSYDMTREYANRMLGNRKDAAAKLLEKALLRFKLEDLT